VRVGKFGKPAVIEVTPGAALEVASPTANAVRIAAHVTVSGAGPDGNGAFRNDGTTQQMNAFTDATIQLADDTVVNASTQRWDIRNSVLDLNGHVLTKIGGASLCLPGTTTISNAPVGAAVLIQDGVFNIESDGRFHPADAARSIDIGAAGTLSLFNLVQLYPGQSRPPTARPFKTARLTGCSTMLPLWTALSYWREP
jgi:hypothetical protein